MTNSQAIVSVGEVRQEPFEQLDEARILNWLTDAAWLDRWPPNETESPETLVEFVRRHGAITLDEPLAPPPAWLGPAGEIVLSSGEVVEPAELLRTRGWRLASDTPPDRRNLVDYGDLRTELWQLRSGLRIAFSRQMGDESWRDLALDPDGPIARLEQVTSPRSSKSGDGSANLVRLWFAAHLGRPQLRVLPVAPPGRDPIALTIWPASPRQQLWLTLAVTSGDLESPFAIDGFFRCAYQRCRKISFREPRNLKGKNRFCSGTDCGKNFWAAKSTTDRRAREKARRESTEESES